MIYDTPAQKLGCINVFINEKLVNSQLKKEIKFYWSQPDEYNWGDILSGSSETCPGEVRRRAGCM